MLVSELVPDAAVPGVDLSAIVKAYDVRGLVPEQLNARVAQALGTAFAQLIAVPEGAASVIIGHDMRPSSPQLSAAFAAGVRAAGVGTVEIGLAATDGLYFASGHLDLPGAMFTASHNPAAYNGIKLTRAGARPVGADSGLPQIRERAQELLDGSHGQAESAAQARDTGAERHTRAGSDTRADNTTKADESTSPAAQRRDLLADYGAFLRNLVDLSASRPLTVVVDAANGMAGLTVPAVLGTAAGLSELPIRIVPLYFELDGTFPNHEANPLDPANLRDLQRAVVAAGADLGLAFDGDADRCFVVDERGEPVSPSAITALVAEREIARAVADGTPIEQIAVVHNVITSDAVPQTIRAAGARPVRTRVGHSYIKAVMAQEGAVFGGEHSAHYYFRDFWFADTGMLAALHVLAALGEQDGPLSELVAAYDPYAASGELNTTVADAPAVLVRIRDWAQGQGLSVDELDGLTVRHPGGDDAGGGGDPMWWANVRPSNTEPLLRLNVEAADTATMERVRDTVLAIIRGDNDEQENPV